MRRRKTRDTALISAGRQKPQEDQSLIHNERILLLHIMSLFLRDAAGSELKLEIIHLHHHTHGGNIPLPNSYLLSGGLMLVPL